MRRKGKTAYMGCAHLPARSSRASANKKRIRFGAERGKKNLALPSRRCETGRSKRRAFFLCGISSRRRNASKFPFVSSSFICTSRLLASSERREARKWDSRRASPLAGSAGDGMVNVRGRVSVALKELRRTPIALVTIRPRRIGAPDQGRPLTSIESRQVRSLFLPPLLSPFFPSSLIPREWLNEEHDQSACRWEFKLENSHRCTSNERTS